MNKKILFQFAVLAFINPVLGDAKLESKLNQQCLKAFEVIEKNQPEKFIEMLPIKIIDESEIKKIRKHVNRRHNKYIVEGLGWSELKLDDVSFGNPDARLIEKFGGDDMVRLSYYITLRNTKKPKRYSFCSFTKLNEKWFLVQLP